MYAATSTAPKNFVRPAIYLATLLIGAVALILTGYGILPFSFIITTPLMALLIMGKDNRPLLDGKPDPAPAPEQAAETHAPRHIRPRTGAHAA
jgi:hypothetical protein